MCLHAQAVPGHKSKDSAVAEEVCGHLERRSERLSASGAASDTGSRQRETSAAIDWPSDLAGLAAGVGTGASWRRPSGGFGFGRQRARARLVDDSHADFPLRAQAPSGKDISDGKAWTHGHAGSRATFSVC
jgi:hypothetical protein